MAGEIDARRLVQRLNGRTIPTLGNARPNTVLGLTGSTINVGTEDSPDGSSVPLRLLQEGLDILIADGEIRIEPDTFGGARRSSFVGAALGQLHGVTASDRPVWVRLEESALSPLLERACTEIQQPRLTFEVSGDDPFHRLIVHDIRDQLSQSVGTALKCKGSAGQSTWAETPWTGVFDPLVTESAQQGYYLVFLFPRDGSGVHLSLMQGTTAVRKAHPRRAAAVLQDRATTYAAYIEQRGLEGLHQGRIDLQGTSARTSSYEDGSIVSRFYEAGAIPADPVLGEDLLRFIRLYAALIESLDRLEAENSPDTPGEARQGEEARRYRWHLRAEGRNRSVVRRAKELQGYVCQVCDVDFVAVHSDIGRRSIEAHHKQPFHTLGDRPRAVDPLEDFAIVCANHHRMLHSETPPLTVEALRSRLGFA